ncbi:HAD family phosphatase [Candidatus Saccharibacteria bacterium]|nr:HAD family phosphatase [Candidatus Saccharibacteria bacterium]
MIKAVLFDCFGVLTGDLWKQFVDSQPEDVDTHLLKELNRQLDSGYIGREQFLNEVHKEAGSYPQEVEKLLNNELSKNVLMLDIIRELKGRGYKIGLLSNISSNWIRDSFLTINEQDLFDAMIMSFEVKVAKPSPEIYNIACEKLACSPSEILFIDDGEDNCRGANSIGMKTIHYIDFKSFKTELENVLNHG